MSNHFTYEIDERNLRVQLKNLEIQLKEDAWQKFENFSESQKSFHNENRLKKFQVPLNRNVILPVVFGLIIIAFSFLLFNFINIKNPSRQNSQKAELKQASIAPELKSTNEKPHPQKPKTISQTASQTNTTSSPAAEMPVNENKTTLENTAKFSSDTSNPAQQSGIANVSATNTDSVKTDFVKKKRKRRSSDVVETEEFRDIRPTLVADDQESEVRPD